MFVEAQTRKILAEVCQRLKARDTGAILFRHHSNAVYAVEDVVVKIAPVEVPLERVDRMVRVVRWMVSQELPTVRLSDRLAEQPIDIGGHAVTVWERLDPNGASLKVFGW